MSCGEPHDVDCADVLDRLYLLLDGELDRVTVATVRVHLEECAPCLAEHDLEAAIKALVARACRCEAPEGLRARILARIDEVRVARD